MSDIVAKAISFFNQANKKDKDIDLTSALTWSYTLSLPNENQVDSVTALLLEKGFTTVQPPYHGGRQQCFLVDVLEVKVHSVESFAERIKELEDFGQRNGCKIVSWGVDDSPEK